jgi:hypothetical protein
LAKRSNLISRLLQITAFIFFIYAGYRLYIYFIRWLPPPEFMLYAIFLAIFIGTGILIFDDVYKPGRDYVGWAVLFGVGVLSLIIGNVFHFIPPNPHPPSMIFGPFWSRTIFFIVMGVVLIIEALLVRRQVVPGDNGLNSDTIGPVILKFTAIFGLAFGGYQMAWVIVPFLRQVNLLTLLPLLLSALGFVLVCSILIIYVETQKRQPHFRMRRLPLLLSFLLLLMILPVTTIYLQVYLINPVMIEILFNAIMALALAIAILLMSFYIVYHPTKAR